MQEKSYKKDHDSGQVEQLVIQQTDGEKLLALLKEWKKDYWWYGWEAVCDELECFEGHARKVMNDLKKQGLVRAEPIFDHDLKLRGKGWFVV